MLHRSGLFASPTKKRAPLPESDSEDDEDDVETSLVSIYLFSVGDQAAYVLECLIDRGPRCHRV